MLDFLPPLRHGQSFWILLAAVAAPLLAEIRIGVRLPGRGARSPAGQPVGPAPARPGGLVPAPVPGRARGAATVLYRSQIPGDHRWAFALTSAVPSLSIVVVTTELGTRSKVMSTDLVAALVEAALLDVLLFPTIADSLLARVTMRAATRKASRQNLKPAPK